VLSVADAAMTTTATISPRTSTATPRLRPDTFFAASLPVVADGTWLAARIDWVSKTIAVGSSARPALSLAWQRSRSWMAWSVPSSRHNAK
jgi:hypothetical protein